MTKLGELLSVGFGQDPTSPLFAARRQLTWRERQRVHRLARRGEPAWDARSAHYAVEVSRATERTPQLFGPTTTRILMLFIAALQARTAWSNASDDLPFLSIFFAVVAIAFAILTLRLPAWLENAPRARQANQAILDAGGGSGAWTTTASASAKAHRVRPRDQRLGFVLAVVLMGVLFGAGIWIGDGEAGGPSVAGALAGGVLFGLVFVPVLRGIARRSLATSAAERAGAPQPPSAALSATLWKRVPSKGRRPLRIGGTAFGLLVAWFAVVGETQLSACDDTVEHFVPPRTGFAKAFCGAAGATTTADIVVYALLVGLPVVGLLLAAFGAGWRDGRGRVVLLGSGLALVVLPVALAWLLAGAH